MKIAIFYDSKTGNTKQLAEAIQSALVQDDVIYCGQPDSKIRADLYFIGSWTDKGNASELIVDALKSLDSSKIAYFQTAGFGGSLEYYEALFSRVSAIVDPSNQILGHFFCQGKMPMALKNRYVSLLKQNPEDKKLQVSLKNFDQALSHPDAKDLEQVKAWANDMVLKAV